MLISSFDIRNFRNLKKVFKQCSPGLNLIVGENASGKTSVLEALYFLGRARSFRTRRLRELIRGDETTFRLVAVMTERVGERSVVVGIERGVRETVARIGGNPVGSLAELANQVPVLLLNPESHRLLSDGPKQRRRFIDWGLFHGDASFIQIWRRYGAALRHRNAALRAHTNRRSMDAWDGELAQAAVILDSMRRRFCETLQEALTPFAGMLLGGVRASVNYARGWSQGQDFRATLASSREQDRKLGYTYHGPHRADFTVKLDDRISAEWLSRGQQKLLIAALILAQAELYRSRKRSPCILLIDDLPSELDRTHRDRLLNCLARMDVQVFVTAIEAEALDTAPWPDKQIFSIANGSIS